MSFWEKFGENLVMSFLVVIVVPLIILFLFGPISLIIYGLCVKTLWIVILGGILEIISVAFLVTISDDDDYY